MAIKDCLIFRREPDIPPLLNVKELKISAADEIKPPPYSLDEIFPKEIKTELEVTTFPYLNRYVPPNCVEETAGEKSKVLLATMCYTKVGRKKKKQIKKQLKKQFGEQARGETFKSLLKKQFVERFKPMEVNRLYTTKSLKGLKVTLMCCTVQEGSTTNGLCLSIQR